LLNTELVTHAVNMELEIPRDLNREVWLRVRWWWVKTIIHKGNLKVEITCSHKEQLCNPPGFPREWNLNVKLTPSFSASSWVVRTVGRTRCIRETGSLCLELSIISFVCALCPMCVPMSYSPVSHSWRGHRMWQLPFLRYLSVLLLKCVALILVMCMHILHLNIVLSFMEAVCLLGRSLEGVVIGQCYGAKWCTCYLYIGGLSCLIFKMWMLHESPSWTKLLALPFIGWRALFVMWVLTQNFTCLLLLAIVGLCVSDFLRAGTSWTLIQTVEFILWFIEMQNERF
jgi:hypothetical protein